MKDQLVLDLETQNSFDDVGGRDYLHLLKVSLVGIYSYAQDKYLAYEEKDIPQLEELLKNTDLIIGFNTKYFDYTVLQPYLKDVILKDIPSCDIMEDITNVLGHRLSLDAIGQATLHIGKSGHGLDAIKYFREGDMEKLTKYCLDDVRITRGVFEYGKDHKKLLYTSKYKPGNLEVPVDWDEYIIPQNTQTISEDKIMEDAKEDNAHQVDAQSGNYSLF